MAVPAAAAVAAVLPHLDKIVQAVAPTAARLGYDRLRRDPEKQAFKRALRAAMTSFERDHSDWAKSLFDQVFLTGQAAPVLAQALNRNGAAATDLARAYAAQFGGSSAEATALAAKAEPIAADFLQRLEVAIGDEKVFRPNLDSQDIVKTRRYQQRLLEQSQEGWAAERQESVIKALSMLDDAANTYFALGSMLVNGQAVTELDEVPPTSSIDTARKLLASLRYADRDELITAMNAVCDGYAAISDRVRTHGAGDPQNADLLRDLRKLRDELKTKTYRASQI